MEVKEYTLRTVEDFLKIPENKILACLTDFSIWVQMHHTSPLGQIMERDELVWKDDGLVGLSELRVKQEGE